MEFSYCYRITYESGETYDRKKDLLVVEISKEDYKKIISGVLQGISAIKKMKNPIETLERPEEHMTIYRNDDSSVTLSTENGCVSIIDSRKKNVCHVVEADYFISNILH